MRPKLLIGFAAETENVIENGKRKLSKCDWVLANDISLGIFGSDETQVHFLTPDVCETWPRCGKKDVAKKLIARCEEALYFSGFPPEDGKTHAKTDKPRNRT
jgi:phosphopantothenoylcysteine decarboxylase / phosphopantothenate---cysteine ligase